MKLFAFLLLGVIGPTLAHADSTRTRGRAILDSLQDEATREKWTFQLKYNERLERPVTESTGFIDDPERRSKGIYYVPRHRGLPRHFDWREERQGLTPIKNQGACQGCWAFGTAAVLENAIWIFDKARVSLSEQQLIDCDGYSDGCNGGYFAHYLQKSPGSAPSSDYPFKGYTASCKQQAAYPDKIEGWGYIGTQVGNASVAELKAAIYEYGIIAATVYADNRMVAYAGGVYNKCTNYYVTNHMVNLVGWDDDGGYFIVRNSWGENWGEQGYMRILYNCNRIGQWATFVKYKPRCTPQPIAFPGSDRTIAAGGSTRLGSMPVVGQTYRWTPATGLDNANDAMPLATPAATTTYMVTATSDCGSATGQVKVTVQ